MPVLETQVGQIYINNKKLSKSFVSLFSEKIAESDAEIFILLEVSPYNPAAAPEYDKMAKSIANILRRNYRKPNQNAFENAIAQTNDELASIAGRGHINWVGKFNACIAVRQNENLSVATVGKVHAYLFRDEQFSDIAEPAGKQNPLKTFENFAIGKIAKRDALIFTTAELFNYISIERMRKILSDLSIAAACRTTADLIKDLAPESVSFGTFIVELGDAREFSALPEEERPAEFEKPRRGQAAMNVAKNMFSGSIRALGAAWKFAAHTMMLNKKPGESKINIQTLNAELMKERAKVEREKLNIKNLPRAKRFFLIAAGIFLALLIINVIVAVRVHYSKKISQDLSQQLTDIRNKINDSNTAFIYNDQKTALDLLNAARKEFEALPQNSQITDQVNKMSTDLAALENNLEHVKTVAASSVLTYNGAAIDALELVNNTLYLINYQGGLVVPYSLSSNAQQPDFTVSTGTIKNLTLSNGLFIAEDKDGNIYEINPAGKTAIKQTGQLAANSTGLASYGAPIKLYTLDKGHNQIVYGPLDSAAVPYMQIDAKNLTDLAIDGSVYLLGTDGIKKFNSRQPKTFESSLTFSDSSKIYTDKSLNYIYVLDPGKKRLILFDKSKGAVFAQYTSDQFKNLKCFVVDEKNKVVYIVSDQTVFVIHL